MRYDRIRNKGSLQVGSWLTTVSLIIVLFVAQSMGWLGFFIHSDAAFLATLGFMAWQFAKAFRHQHWLYGSYDLERTARDIVLKQLKKAVESPQDREKILADLISGKKFVQEHAFDNMRAFDRFVLKMNLRFFSFMEKRNAGNLEDTGIATMFSEVKRDLLVNPNLPMDISGYFGLYRARVSAAVKPALREAGDQTLLGLLGTVLGLVLAFRGVDWSSFSNADAAVSFMVVFGSGLGFALVITLSGIGLTYFLRRRNYRLETSFDNITNDLWNTCMTIDRVLTDADQVNKVAVALGATGSAAEGDASP